MATLFGIPSGSWLLTQEIWLPYKLSIPLSLFAFPLLLLLPGSHGRKPETQILVVGDETAPQPRAGFLVRSTTPISWLLCMLTTRVESFPREKNTRCHAGTDQSHTGRRRIYGRSPHRHIHGRACDFLQRHLHTICRAHHWICGQDGVCADRGGADKAHRFRAVCLPQRTSSAELRRHSSPQILVH